MADAKRTAREMKNLDRDHERLWRMEDELIPQFIHIRPRVVARKLVKYESQIPYAIVHIRELAPLLTLLASRVDDHL